MTNGYNLFFVVPNALDDGKLEESEILITFPITPSELTISRGSNNDVVTLIDEGDINILKSPSLTEVEFTARFPMRKYPYSREFKEFESYKEIFEDLKESKKPFRFIVTRATPDNKSTWNTNLLVALEDMDSKESADEGDDVLITFKLKQYKNYGIRKLESQITTSTANKPREDVKPSGQTTYTVKDGDTLYLIAKKLYNDGSKWTLIYNANKNIIEETAKKNRNGQGSSNGGYIYPGTVLVIPALTASTTVGAKAKDTLNNSVVTPTTNESTITVTMPEQYKQYFSVQIAYGEGSGRSTQTKWGTQATATTRIGNKAVVRIKKEASSYKQSTSKQGSELKLVSWRVNNEVIKNTTNSDYLSFNVTEKTYTIEPIFNYQYVAAESCNELLIKHTSDFNHRGVIVVKYLDKQNKQKEVTINSTNPTELTKQESIICRSNTIAQVTFKSGHKVGLISVTGNYTTSVINGYATFTFTMSRNASIAMRWVDGV